MDAWRAVVMVGFLLAGCGGPSGEGNQEDERPNDSLPTDMPDTVPPDGQEQEEPGETDRQQPPAPEPGPTGPSGQPALGTARRVTELFPAVDTAPWISPAPKELVAFQDALYFAANLEDGRSGVWRSDGTSAGTFAVKEFPALEDTHRGAVDELTPVGAALFFTARDAAHGQELWVSDGTSPGTRLVRDLVPGTADGSPYRLTALGTSLVFFQYVPEQGSTPGHSLVWRTDGTAAGTVLIKDLGAESSLSTSEARVGGTLYFVVSDAAHGTELWKTDGTASGTGLVRDIEPGAANAYPHQLQVVGSQVFFLTTTSSFGTQLWRTNGTEAGTQQVRELSAGPDGAIPHLLPAVGSTLYLAQAEPSDQLMRLYTLGAGETEPTLVATLPNPYAEEQDALPTVTTAAVAGGKVFFGLGITSSGPAPRDVQLWVSDGTGAGTVRLARPLSLSDEFTTQLYPVGDQVLFSAMGQGTGLEPWVSDGTAAGTRRLQDLAPGADGSFPREYTRVGDAVFFVAYTPEQGNEVWILPPAP